MGNISTSFTLPCPKTACHRALFWTAQKLRLRNFEISDHTRQVIRTTINLDRARTPAATLRRCLNDRLDRQPDTMAIFWAGPNDTNTALSISIQYIWTLTPQRGSNISQLWGFDEKPPIAHCRRTNLFSTRIFGRNSPLCPGATLTEELKYSSPISRFHQSSTTISILKYTVQKTPSIFIFNAHYLPLVILPQKLSQPIVFYSYTPLRFLCEQLKPL